MLAKVSLLLFLYRIFHVDFKFRIASWIIGFVVVVWSLVTLFLMIFSCHPVKANWDVALLADPKTHCYPKVYNVINIHGYCNIITDFALLFLPLPMVKGLQMSLKKKFSVATIFATGALYVHQSPESVDSTNTTNSICAIAIVRQYIVYNTNKAGDNWVATRNTIWSKPSTPLCKTILSNRKLTIVLSQCQSNSASPSSSHVSQRSLHSSNTTKSSPASSPQTSAPNSVTEARCGARQGQRNCPAQTRT